jgi:hypothetical protein
MSIQELVNFWAEELPANDRGQWLHPSDEPILGPWLAKKPRTAVLDDLPRRSGRLHLELHPVPYVGNLQAADIFFAMINPKVHAQDYKDAQSPAFRELLRKNFDQSTTTCFALDLNSVDAGWHGYYRSIFNRFVREYEPADPGLKRLHLKDRTEMVWQVLMTRLAVVELIPYYSQTAELLITHDLHKKLPSAKAARAALQEVANRPMGDALIICRWPNGALRWEIPLERCTVSDTRNGLSKSAKEALSRFMDCKPYPDWTA